MTLRYIMKHEVVFEPYRQLTIKLCIRRKALEVQFTLEMKYNSLLFGRNGENREYSFIPDRLLINSQI